jgi:hypothetical protein
LVENGSALHMEDEHGRDPLENALMNSHMEVAEYLKLNIAMEDNSPSLT